MNLLKSFLFNIQFYIGTSILVTICLPCLLFPRPVVIYVNKIWCLIMTKGMKWWLNTDIRVIGKIPSKNKVVIYAIKHQSCPRCHTKCFAVFINCHFPKKRLAASIGFLRP